MGCGDIVILVLRLKNKQVYLKLLLYVYKHCNNNDKEIYAIKYKKAAFCLRKCVQWS